MRRPSRPLQLTAIGCALVLAYVLLWPWIEPIWRDWSAK
jgi:hypothetical protein